MKSLMIAVLTLTLCGGSQLAAQSVQLDHAKSAAIGHSAVTPSETFRRDMRKLWSDHVYWTRDYIVAATANQPDKDAAAARLLRNQEDIGNVVATFYGRDAGNQLTVLLKDHIQIAVDLINAAKVKDQTKFQEFDRKWDRNAEDIVAFLSKANPKWSKADLTSLMKMHLTTTKQEVTARLSQNWAEDVKAFDAVYDHILKMSDALADGIIMQFPAKFSGGK
jgi:hypothetical protein